MLSVLLHRMRKAAKDAEKVAHTVEEHRQVYGTRLLIRGLLWVSIFMLSRGLLEMDFGPAWLRVVVALFPVPFFIWYLWTWFNGAAAMDELQRRIELEALGFAFPATAVYLMTIGLLDLAITLPPEDFSLHHIWMFLPIAYYAGLWRAKRRYE